MFYMNSIKHNKGGYYALDNICNINRFMAAGYGQLLYSWRIYTCTACNSNSIGPYQLVPRQKCGLVVLKDGVRFSK